MQDIRVAAAIFNAPLGRIPENLERMTAFCLEAADHGAGLICFPEMAITGYSSDTAIVPFALSTRSPRLRCLRQISDEHGLVILTGMAEKDPSGLVFATHLVFLPGKPLLKYRKLHIAPSEKTVFSGGSQIPVFEFQGFKFGIQLCYDAHFPFLSTQMAEKGADAVFIPHASPRGTPEDKFSSWMRHIPARSFDNGVFTVVCNQTGENGSGLSFPGLALITDPSGHVISKDTSDREGLLYADLKKSALDHVRNHSMRYFLPGMRKDLL